MRGTILAAIAALAMAGSAHAANLVLNGSFTNSTGLGGVEGAGYTGAEVDDLWHYGGAVDHWSTTSAGHPQVYNLYMFGTGSETTTDADTRYTSAEPQHPNANFSGDSPDGGAFMLLDGDPTFNGPLEQLVGGLTVDKQYKLGFWYANGELSNRRGFESEQLTGSFGGDAFSTATFFNSHPYYNNPSDLPGDFSGWTHVTFTFTAHAASQTLSFLAAGTPAANLPPVSFLDGVTLTGAPEPAVWGFMVLGFGSLGAMMRRRRRLAAASA